MLGTILGQIETTLRGAGYQSIYIGGTGSSSNTRESFMVITVNTSDKRTIGGSECYQLTFDYSVLSSNSEMTPNLQEAYNTLSRDNAMNLFRLFTLIGTRVQLHNNSRMDVGETKISMDGKFHRFSTSAKLYVGTN